MSIEEYFLLRPLLKIMIFPSSGKPIGTQWASCWNSKTWSVLSPLLYASGFPHLYKISPPFPEFPPTLLEASEVVVLWSKIQNSLKFGQLIIIWSKSEL